jgi:hypothetical protein
MYPLDDLTKINIGTLAGENKALTIEDYVKLKNSNLISRFFFQIQLGIEGKGWWVNEKKIHLLVKNMKWEKIHGISEYAETILSNHDPKQVNKEISSEQIPIVQTIHDLFSNEKKIRLKEHSDKFSSLQKIELNEFYIFGGDVTKKLVHYYMDFFLSENEHNITITRAMQKAKTYLTSLCMEKKTDNQNAYRLPHNNYVQALGMDGFIDYLVQRKLNDKLTTKENEIIDNLIESIKKKPNHFFLLNRSLEQISEHTFYKADFENFIKTLPQDVLLEEKDEKKLHFSAIKKEKGKEEKIKELFIEYLKTNTHLNDFL